MPNLTLNSLGAEAFIKLINKMEPQAAKRALANIVFISINGRQSSLADLNTAIRSHINTDLKDAGMAPLIKNSLLIDNETNLDLLKAIEKHSLYNMTIKVNEADLPLLFFAAISNSAKWFYSILSMYEKEELSRISKIIVPILGLTLPNITLNSLGAEAFIKLINKMEPQVAKRALDNIVVKSINGQQSSWADLSTAIRLHINTDLKDAGMATIIKYSLMVGDETNLDLLQEIEKPSLYNMTMKVNEVDLPLLIYAATSNKPKWFYSILSVYEKKELSRISTIIMPTLDLTLPNITLNSLGAEAFIKLINEMEPQVAKLALDNIVVKSINVRQSFFADLRTAIKSYIKPELKDAGMVILIKYSLIVGNETNVDLLQEIEKSSLYNMAMKSNGVDLQLIVYAAASNKPTWFYSILSMYEKEELSRISTIIMPTLDQTLPNITLNALGAEAFITLINKMEPQIAKQALDNIIFLQINGRQSSLADLRTAISLHIKPELKDAGMETLIKYSLMVGSETNVDLLQEIEKPSLYNMTMKVNGVDFPLLFSAATLNSPKWFHAMLSMYEKAELIRISTIRIPASDLTLPNITLNSLGAEAFITLINKMEPQIAKQALDNIIFLQINGRQSSLADLSTAIKLPINSGIKDIGVRALIHYAVRVGDETNLDILDGIDNPSLYKMTMKVNGVEYPLLFKIAINNSTHLFAAMLKKYNSEELTKLCEIQSSDDLPITFPNLTLNSLGAEAFIKLINKMEPEVAKRALDDIEFLSVNTRESSLEELSTAIKSAIDSGLKDVGIQAFGCFIFNQMGPTYFIQFINKLPAKQAKEVFRDLLTDLKKEDTLPDILHQLLTKMDSIQNKKVKNFGIETLQSLSRVNVTCLFMKLEIQLAKAEEKPVPSNKWDTFKSSITRQLTYLSSKNDSSKEALQLLRDRFEAIKTAHVISAGMPGRNVAN